MSIVVRCRDCGALLKFRDEALGKKAKCTKCNCVVQVVPDDESRKSGDAKPATAFNGSSDAVTTAEPPRERRARELDPDTESLVTETVPVEESVDEQALLSVRPRVRVFVLVLLLLPVVFAVRIDLTKRLLSCFVPVMLTGTYRTSTIRGERFRTRFYLAYFPLTSHRCNLRGVTYLNVRYGREGSGMGTFILLGPLQVVFGRLLDALIPTIGGPYQIDLVTAKGRELSAWRGFDDEKFRSTLALLTTLTGAETRSV